MILSHSFSQSMLPILLIIFLLVQQTCSAKQTTPCSSSCGKILNITYPFRLRGDPRGCGLKRYELDCDNNVTVLNGFSAKYYVQHINYTSYQIRLTDAGVVDDTACPIPRHFFTSYDFSSILDLEGGASEVVFLNCSDPVSDDLRYVQVNPGHCGRHNMYAIVDINSDFRVSDMKDGCHLEIATIADKTLDIPTRNVSYADIRNLLHDGFSMSWLSPLICRDHCGKYKRCSINQTTQQIECSGYGHCQIFGGDSSDDCGMLARIVGDIFRAVRDIIKGFVKRIRHVRSSWGDWRSSDNFLGQNLIPMLLVARYLLGLTLLLVLFIYKWRQRHFSMFENIENFLLDNNLNPIRYEYKEIKQMTKGLKVKLGAGGFGSVYKGKLRSGLDVAVKILSNSKGNGQDFINEVASIGRIHHTNVVSLVGYCVDRKMRALIYEYMQNGSLDKYIFSKEGSVLLSYEKIYEISLGIARGIAYLHQDCDVQILHFDIKPHNILLDDTFIPKVSDFGLAELYQVKDKSIILPAARGTLGYMAPELYYKNIGGVSYKADVYSFGMLLMEMGSRRRNSNPHAENSSQDYFPSWIYDQLIEEKDINMEDASQENKELIKKIDMEDASEEDKELVVKMFIVAFWCIQLKPNDRPSMKKVVEMLEGKVESLNMPPKPSYCPRETMGDDGEINSETMSDDGEINSDQTSWSDSTSFIESVGKTESNHSLEDNT